MKIHNILLIGVMVFGAAVLSACSTDSPSEPPASSATLSEQEVQAGWGLLFDGKTTAGWRGYKQDSIPPGWTVEGGELVCGGQGGDIGGDIITIEQYDNFELNLEWKIAEGGNSGIFYHVVEDMKYQAPYETGPEYQLIDDIGFPDPLEEWQKTGADYAMFTAGDEKILHPVGEWNLSKIVFDNGHVEHRLNGVKIIEFEAWSEEWDQRREAGKWKDYPDYGTAPTGHIGLQDHGHKIRFRNIKLKHL